MVTDSVLKQTINYQQNLKTKYQTIAKRISGNQTLLFNVFFMLSSYVLRNSTHPNINVITCHEMALIGW